MAHKQGSSSFITSWGPFVGSVCACRVCRATKKHPVISGSVKDDADAPVHGAVVGARNLDMGVTTFVVTNPEGEFQTPPLEKRELSNQHRTTGISFGHLRA